MPDFYTVKTSGSPECLADLGINGKHSATFVLSERGMNSNSFGLSSFYTVGMKSAMLSNSKVAG